MGKIKNEEYAKINGIDQYFLHYPSPQREDTPVVIFLHGGPGSSMACLSYVLRPHWDFCPVVYYDQRGASRTQKKNKSEKEDLTVENLIADLRQTIRYVKEKYQTDRVILLGQSWGTVLGTLYIQQYPEDVIAYIGTGQCVDTRRDMQVRYDKLKEVIERKGNKKDLRKVIEMETLPHMKIDDKKYVSMEIRFFLLSTKYGLTLKSGKLLKLMFKSPFFKFSDLYMMIKGPKANLHLSKWMTDGYSVWNTPDYSVPVFYILGRDDWQTSATLATEYFEKINAPQKGLYWIENAGHATDIDNPVDFCEAVKDIVMRLAPTEIEGNQ